MLSLFLAGFIGLVVGGMLGLYGGTWYINTLRRAAGLPPV